jgi:hypothetical protein
MADWIRITPPRLAYIIPEHKWILGSNSVNSRYDSVSHDSYAIIYWDADNNTINGLIYSYMKDSWQTDADVISLYFNGVLETSKDLKQYRDSMPKPYGREKWNPRWRIFSLKSQNDGGWWGVKYDTDMSLGNAEEGKLIDVKGQRAKLGDIFRLAKKDPYIFLSHHMWNYGVINMRFL